MSTGRIYRGGVVYNYGMPRDRVVKIIKRPIYVQKIYKVDNWKDGGFDKGDPNRGIKIYAPRCSTRTASQIAARRALPINPNDFKPKAKLKDTYKGDLPKGLGQSAKDMKSIAKEDPDAFKKKHGNFGPDDQPIVPATKDKDNDQNDKGEVKAIKATPKALAIRAAPTISNAKAETTRATRVSPRISATRVDLIIQARQPRPGRQGRGQGNNTNRQSGRTTTRTPKAAIARQPGHAKGLWRSQRQGGPNQFKQGNRDKDDQGGGGGKPKSFGGPRSGWSQPVPGWSQPVQARQPQSG